MNPNGKGAYGFLKVLEFVCGHFRVTKNLAQQAFPNINALVHWNCDSPSIRMDESEMARRRSRLQLKSESSKTCDNLFGRVNR